MSENKTRTKYWIVGSSLWIVTSDEVYFYVEIIDLTKVSDGSANKYFAWNKGSSCSIENGKLHV